MAARQVKAKASGSPWEGRARAADASPEERKRAILSEAARLFYTNGFHETSLSEIADSLHVTKPTVYYYVHSKQECLLEITRVAQAEVGHAIEKAHRTRGTGLEKLVIFLRKLAEFVTTDCGKCLAIGTHRALVSPYSDEIEGRQILANRRIRDLIQAGIDDGSIRRRDTTVVFHALIGSINWIGSWYDPRGRLKRDEFLDAHIDFLVHGLAD